MILKTNISFEIGQQVYVLTDPDQLPRQVVYIKVTPNGVLYGISSLGEEFECYEIELTEESTVR